MIYLKDSDIAAVDNAWMQQLQISLRRCLSCDHWMRSTGSDHRICNECKGIQEHETRVWAEKVAYWRGGQKVIEKLTHGARRGRTN